MHFYKDYADEGGADKENDPGWSQVRIIVGHIAKQPQAIKARLFRHEIVTIMAGRFFPDGVTYIMTMNTIFLHHSLGAAEYGNQGKALPSRDCHNYGG